MAVKQINRIEQISGYVPADLTAQAANVSATTLLAVPASGASGLYRISVYLVLTQAATTSSTLPSIVITSTDNDSGVAETVTIAGGSTANTLGLLLQSSAVISAKASTNIQYSTTGYASSGATAMQFALHVRAEYLG